MFVVRKFWFHWIDAQNNEWESRKERRHARVKQCNLFVNVSLNTQGETWKLTISHKKVASEKKIIIFAKIFTNY